MQPNSASSAPFSVEWVKNKSFAGTQIHLTIKETKPTELVWLFHEVPFLVVFLFSCLNEMRPKLGHIVSMPLLLQVLQRGNLRQNTIIVKNDNLIFLLYFFSFIIWCKSINFQKLHPFKIVFFRSKVSSFFPLHFVHLVIFPVFHCWMHFPAAPVVSVGCLEP